MKKLAVALLCALSTTVFAEGADLTWTNPTNNQNCTQGSPLTNLAGTRIWQLVAEIADPAVEAYSIPTLPPGDHTFVATAFLDDGTESMVSGSASTTVGPMTVTDSTVFITVKTTDRQLLVAAGTIPVGTECIQDQSLNGHNAVPVDQVTWTGVQSIVAYAKCG